MKKKTLTATFEVTPKSLERIRVTNSLAENMSDEFLTKILQEFFNDITNDLETVIDNVDLFNF